jgi:hypothetical protein
MCGSMKNSTEQFRGEPWAASFQREGECRDSPRNATRARSCCQAETRRRRTRPAAYGLASKPELLRNLRVGPRTSKSRRRSLWHPPNPACSANREGARILPKVGSQILRELKFEKRSCRDKRRLSGRPFLPPGARSESCLYRHGRLLCATAYGSRSTSVSVALSTEAGSHFANARVQLHKAGQ